MNIEKRLDELGIVLPEVVAPLANYVSWQQCGNLLFFSGTGPLSGGKPTLLGKLGDEVSIEQGYAAARDTAINMLAAIKKAVGDLDNVEQIVKLLGFVRCTDDFTDQPAVMNGASDLFVAVFGDKGRHARSAIGTNALPMGIPVEIEMIVRIKV